MTRPELRLWLAAVRRLLRYYQAERPRKLGKCPLCEIDGPCKQCLWVRYEGVSCGKAALSWAGGMCDLRDTRPPAWRKASIARLRRWEARLKKEIEEVKNAKTE